MDILKRSGILIPTTHRNTRSYVNVKEKLERRTRGYGNSAMTINIFYLESEKFLLIPRNFPLQNYFRDIEIHDHRHHGQPIEINHNITPRGEVQERAIRYMMSHENGILQLSPGVGKTVITIYMIAKRKVKSLILVHRDPLATQWKNRFLQFTDIKEEDIVRLSSSTFKEDLDKPIIISTTQTFLSLLKRKRKDFLIKLNEANIGIFVGDEVHTTVGAPTFSECSIHMPSKYTYGLSATPYRYDGNGDIIEYHLGEVFSDDDIQGTMDARVTVVMLDYQIDTPYRTQYIRYGGEFQRARYLNLIRKSKPFVEVVRGLLRRFKDDRQTICIAERINLIEELHKWMPSTSKAMFCGKGGLETLDSQFTFGTPGKVRDGIDAPWKDTVIMTSPISNIEQLTGRVIRAKKNKKTPIIIDMVDYGCSYIARTFYKRKEFYLKKGWKIQYVLYNNSKIKQIDENIALDILKEGT
jgi:superfamily II DNA or RNA helicase